MRFIPNSQFNSKLFSKSELEILERVSEEFKDYSAKRISDLSHDTPEYIDAYDNGIISEESMSGKNKEYVAYWKNMNTHFDMSIHS